MEALRWESLFADERGEEWTEPSDAGGIPRGAISFVTARPADEFFPLEEFGDARTPSGAAKGREVLQFGPSDGYHPLKQALVRCLRARRMPDERRESADHRRLPAGDRSGLQSVSPAGRYGRARKSGLSRERWRFSQARASECSRFRVNADKRPRHDAGRGYLRARSGADAEPREMIFLTPDFHNPTGTALPGRRSAADCSKSPRGFRCRSSRITSMRACGCAAERVPSLKQLDRHGNWSFRLTAFRKSHFPECASAGASARKRDRAVAPGEAIHRFAHRSACRRRAWPNLCAADYLGRHLGKHEEGLSRAAGSAWKRRWAAKCLPERNSWTRPDGGMCVWVELPPGFDAESC